LFGSNITPSNGQPSPFSGEEFPLVCDSKYIVLGH